MWEFECHDWPALRGFRDPKNVRPYLERLADSTDEKEWQKTLNLLQVYASDLGLPSEATKDVVACLIAVVIRVEGKKRSELLGALEELTCGRGLEVYSAQQLECLRSAVSELALALHTWVYLAESASREDATLALQLLAYCAVYVEQLEPKVSQYFRLCAAARPELRDEISSLLVNADEVRQLLTARGNRVGI